MALGRWEGANFAAEFAWGVLLIIVLGVSQRIGTGPMKFLRTKGAELPATSEGSPDEERKELNAHE